MKIVLMRHGKPMINKHLRLNATEFGAWVEKYNIAGIDTRHESPREAIEQAKQCAMTVCSNLARSLESAKILGVKHIGLCSPMFREMDMPHATWRLPRLSPAIWLIFFRFAWVFGYSANTESFKAAKARARNCAEQLAGISSTYGTVLFVGHGSLNLFIAKYLKRMGWICSEKPPRKYWEHSIFTLNTRVSRR